MRELTPQAKVYLFGLALLAATLGAFLVFRADVPQGRDLILTLILAALSVVTNRQLVYFTTERGISLGFSAIFAALLLFDPGVAVAIALTGILAANLMNRHSFYFTLCDSADAVLATGCAGLVLSAVEPGPTILSDPAHLALALIAAVVMFVINVVDWGIVYVLNGEGSWSSELREIRDGAHILAFCLEIALGFLIAALAVRLPWALIFLVIPAYAAFIVVERQVRSRRRTRESLVRTEASLANAQRIAHVGSWEWATDEALMMWSDETYRILGFESQARLATKEEYVDRAHSDDRSRLQGALDLAADKGESFDLEYRVVRPGGEIRFVYLRGEAEQEESGGTTRLVGTLLDITERKELERRLEYQAYHDSLTELPNRALFTDRLEIALSRTRRQGGRVAVLLIDLDGFKQVNDAMGHRAGDILLQAVSGRLSEILRPHDTVARLGGDEFVLLIDEANEEDVAKVAGRIIEAVRVPHVIHGRHARVNASVGIVLSKGESNPDWLLRAADLAMYEAKRGGRGRYKFYSEPDFPKDFRMLLA